MAKNLDKTYNPAEVEKRTYKMWCDRGYFKTKIDKEKEPFTIVIPPPNVTGQLHMGHALDLTLQDIVIRYKRMQGFAALWVPGTDHAGIATQIKVEEALRNEEGKTRHDLGRERFLERVWEWKKLYGGKIINQLKTLGASCDWDRERFTMDEGCSKAVREVFVNLYNKGLIYQGNRIINWCPDCHTALSDTEVEHMEVEGNLYHIKYPVEGSKEFVEVATTRPETMLGDTAVAVHPDDKRYKHLKGSFLILPLVGRRIPVIFDDYVDMSFGTGCVKITPCHDPNDFEMAQRHDLEQILVIGEDAKINENGGKYEGMDRLDARKKVLNDLKELGLLVGVEPLKHNVGHCYRCSNMIEPLTSKQWFVKMEPLAKPALHAVYDGDVSFIPERFTKTYTNWMENVRDWCISRQLWWGHRIPAFYCDDCGEITVSKTDITVCLKCNSSNIRQDEDVLDTWFSSALWPFSTLGWPEKTADFEYFYPTNVLITAYDIIFFWVSRMIFSGLEHTGKKPFSQVFIHGIVRDSQGRKMSKSLGNGIDPLEVIDEFGADALRFNLVMGTTPGNDIRYIPEKAMAARNFTNKIWNASRFALLNLSIDKIELPKDLKIEDKWILSKYNSLVKEITENLDKYEVGIAATKLYDFIWDNLCDWYIELIKPRLYGGAGDADCENAQRVLCYVLSNTLKLLHPIMPFITEEIWQALPHEGESIMISDWPKYSESLSFPEDEASMERVIELIRAVRNRRSEMNVPPSIKTAITIVTETPTLYEQGRAYIEKLAYADSVTVSKKQPDISGCVALVLDGARAFIPLSQLVDTEKEVARLMTEKKRLENEIARVEGKLNNKGFVDKAPEQVIAAEREKGEKYRLMLEKVLLSLKEYGRE